MDRGRETARRRGDNRNGDKRGQKKIEKRILLTDISLTLLQPNLEYLGQNRCLYLSLPNTNIPLEKHSKNVKGKGIPVTGSEGP
jgi:hypothetical protein